MDNDSAISVRNVSKQFRLPHEKTTTLKSHVTGFFRRRRGYEAQQALKDISFEIKKGEFFGIVGRNGSGKSTLLKILANIYQPSEGSVIVRGKLVPFIELGVGFNPELTGRENVYLNGALLGFSNKQIDSMYEDIVSFAELEKFMDQKLKNYSSGMQVRLAFSMAIRAQADILLVDEVLAVGDADFQRKCFEYFRTLKRDKKTVVFVSHDMSAVREYCDRAIMIERSKLVAEGDSEKIASKYSQLFLDVKDADSEEAATEDRWGTGDIRYQDVKVDLSGPHVLVKAKVIAKNEVEHIRYGLHVVAQDGQEVFATSNQLLKISDIKSVKRGEKVTITWKVLNIFNDGKFSINLTLADATTVFDWYYDAAKFRVKREERSTTPIFPPVEVISTSEEMSR